MKYLYLLIFLIGATATFAQTSWVKKGGPLGGEVDDLEYYPGTSNVWALVGGRVYRSSDDGVTWATPSNNIFSNNTIYDIEISNNTIYFLAYDALYATTDQGANLTTLSDGLFQNGLKIKRLPVSGGLVILSGSGSTDIYYSTNNGTTWNAGYNTSSINLGYLAVNAVDQIFVLVNIGAGIYRPFRSTDNGATFSEFSSGITAGLNAQSVTNSTTGDVYCVTLTDIHLLGGSTWSSAKGGQITDATIASASTTGSFMTFTRDGAGMYFIDNFNHKLYAKAVSDAPSGWINQATNFPNTPNGAIWPTLPVYAAASKNFPLVSSNIVFGTLYGIVRSSTGGATNPETNTGITQLGPDKTIATGEGTLLMKTYTIGLLRSLNSGDAWSRVTSVPINITDVVNVLNGSVPTDGTSQLVLASNLVLYQSTDDGSSFNSITTPASFFNIYGGDNKRAFGRSGSSVYFSASSGQTWSAAPIPLGLPGGVSMNDFYVPTTTSTLYAYVNNAGTNQFYKITPTYGSGDAVTSSSATLMANPPFSPGTVYASNGKLYVYSSSSDLVTVYDGTSWSASRPVANGKFFIAKNNGYLFVTESGTTNKIYMSTDDGVTFTSTDLPDGIFPGNVNDVTVSPQDFVFLSIYGNYIYQSKTKVVPPAAPTGLTEIASFGNVYSFKWTDNAYNETAYRILRSSDGGTTYSVIGTVDSGDICSTTTLGGTGYFADNTVVPGTTYRYKVKAVNEAGETESAVLAQAVPVPSFSQPSIPDNRSWSAQNTGGSYSVQSPKVVSIQSQGNGRYRVSDILDNTIASTSAPQDFYVGGLATVVGNAATIGSFYQVKPNGTGTWNGSNQITLLWRSCDDPTKTEKITFTLQSSDPVPAAPVLQAVITTTSQIELSWGNVDYAANYIVERSTTSASSGFSQLGGNIAYPTTLTTDNSVTIGTTYYYRVKARNANLSPQDSPYSNVVTVAFQAPNFSVSATTVSSYVATTLGSFWADFDNDGNEDLLTVNGTINGVGLATVTIFKNLGNGNFEVKSVATDVQAYNFGAVADIDGDGKMDFSVAIAETAQVDFYKGNGDFTFTKFTPAQLGDLASVVKGERQGIMWGDINNDGLLDVIMSGDYDPLLDDRISVCIQNGDHTFTSIHAGDLSDLTVSSFSTTWIDSNNDGYVDVLVSGGGQPLRLYKNNGDKTFTLLSPSDSGIGLSGFLGLTVADFNNDGFMDIYAGGSGGSQPSVIYQNDGDGTFTLKNTTLVTEAVFVVSPTAGDINNDGLIDLLVPGFFGGPTKLFINTGSGSIITFSAVTSEKINDANYWHVGTAFGDYNKDGFLDVALGSLKNINNSDNQFAGGENYLFKNNNSTGNWTQIKLVGVTANKNGLGSRITVVAGGKTYTRDIANSTSFTSLNSLTQHFGLGSASSITSISVKWPTTPVATQVLTNQPVNTIITITQDTYPPTVTAQTPTPGATGIAVNTGLDVTFSEASTAVAGRKLNITKTGDSSPTFSIDVATATAAGNKFSFTLPGALIENTHYDITIEAGAFVDQFQNPIAAVGGWGFTTTNVDAAAPVFGDQSGKWQSTVDKSALPLQIGIPITDNRAVTAASIFVKSISGSAFTEIPGTVGTAPTWNFAVSADKFDGMGLQFYFTAKDAAGNTTRSPLTGVNTIKVIYTGTEAQIPAGLIGTGGTATGWKVIAVPFDLAPNNGVQVVFDELTNATPALTVKEDYRILRYTETPAPAWLDYPAGFSTIDRGAGYFINIKSPVNLIIGTNLVAPDNTRSNLFTINLKAGWNMVGNPYLDAIDWSNVVNYNHLTGTNATVFKKFSGGSYSNSGSIAAYEGGFVRADAAVTVTIPFGGQDGPGRMQQVTFGDNEWLVPISIQQGGINNDFGGVGMHSKALLSYDMLDDINGPRWFEFTEMNFSHPEHIVKNFARDVVPVSDEFEWNFAVDSNLPDVATLNWDNNSYVIGNDLYLYDVATQTPVNMRERSSYSFNAKVSRNFRVLYGANALAKIKPAKLMLSVPYPNPTAGSSTVQFSIPERDGGNAINVSLDVFDMTGRKISTIANGQFAPGFYNGQWDANEAMGSGMYFYRLTAGNEVVTSKIILRK